jgi:hypothetical protein
MSISNLKNCPGLYPGPLLKGEEERENSRGKEGIMDRDGEMGSEAAKAAISHIIFLGKRHMRCRATVILAVYPVNSRLLEAGASIPHW